MIAALRLFVIRHSVAWRCPTCGRRKRSLGIGRRQTRGPLCFHYHSPFSFYAPSHMKEFPS